MKAQYIRHKKIFYTENNTIYSGREYIYKEFDKESSLRCSYKVRIIEIEQTPMFTLIKMEMIDTVTSNIPQNTKENIFYGVLSEAESVPWMLYEEKNKYKFG